MERPVLTSVVLRIKPCKVCVELAPDASPTHGSGSEHVCAGLYRESSKGAVHPRGDTR